MQLHRIIQETRFIQAAIGLCSITSGSIGPHSMIQVMWAYRRLCGAI